MLKFDTETLRILDVSYHGADIIRRRMENMAALAPQPGECILDLGCGQGLMTEELARAVGPTGEVIGVDPSPDMRSQAQVRCAGYPNVRILDGGAGDIPTGDRVIDGAVSLQVFEYLQDIPAALADLHGKMRQGGRLAIGDMQWQTLSWSSDDPERMTRMQLAWERHVAEPGVPAMLPAALEKAGFQLVELRPVPFAACSLRPDGLAFMLMHLMRAYAIQNDLMPAQDADAWFAEQERRAAVGTFFFSLTHFIAIAFKR